MLMLRSIRMAAGAVMAALLLASCGGGNDPAFDRLIVAGDSLADAGTFGLKFTVQNAADPRAGYPVYPELVADALDVGKQCNYYVYASGTFGRNAADCNNYAVGGGRIHNPASNGGAASPLSIPRQLQTAGANVVVYGDRDLVLVDGGATMRPTWSAPTSARPAARPAPRPIAISCCSS